MTSGVFRGHFLGDIEGVLQHYGGRARVVALWRQHDASPSRWIYLGRLAPEECHLTILKDSFGGGWYRAKIYGHWNRYARREEYLQQVSFGIDGPPTAETVERMRRP